MREENDDTELVRNWFCNRGGEEEEGKGGVRACAGEKRDPAKRPHTHLCSIQNTNAIFFYKKNTNTDKLNVNSKYCDAGLTFAACKIHIQYYNAEYKYDIL